MIDGKLQLEFAADAENGWADSYKEYLLNSKDPQPFGIFKRRMAGYEHLLALSIDRQDQIRQLKSGDKNADTTQLEIERDQFQAAAQVILEGLDYQLT
tara:strand:+ start:112 stop:405 length:294 start_codon:yes stop_codon:yes gene_type:complete